MSAIQIGFLILWVVGGVAAVVRWKWRQPEVSLLDIVCAVIIGSIFGPLLSGAVWLHSVKLKGGAA